MSTPQEFFESIPLVTRYQIYLSLGASLAFLTGLASPMYFILSFPLVFNKFQIWRLLSNHLILGKGFGLIIRLMHIYKYGSELERGAYSNNSVEYSFTLFCCIMVETVAAYFLNLQVLSFATVHMILYLWARNNPTQQVSVMGVITLAAPYLPWAFVVITVIMGGDPLLDLLGIFCGHVYWFLTDVLPKTHGTRLISTPGLWYRLWGDLPPATQPNEHARRNMFGGHSWGSGQRLHND